MGYFPCRDFFDWAQALITHLNLLKAVSEEPTSQWTSDSSGSSKAKVQQFASLSEHLGWVDWPIT